MREIFRGRTTDTNKWVYGYYYELKGTTYIIEKETGFFDIDCGEVIFGTAYCHEVIPETVGQYTGLKDKNDIEICKGDIIRIVGNYFNGTIFEGNNTFGVIYYAGTYVIRDTLEECLHNTFKNASWGISRFYNYDIEIVGNITDNPELLIRQK